MEQMAFSTQQVKDAQETVRVMQQAKVELARGMRQTKVDDVDDLQLDMEELQLDMDELQSTLGECAPGLCAGTHRPWCRACGP